MTRACISSWAPSDTRRLRNPDQKIVGKPCAGKPHARIERGKGKQAASAVLRPGLPMDPRTRRYVVVGALALLVIVVVVSALT